MHLHHINLLAVLVAAISTMITSWQSIWRTVWIRANPIMPAPTTTTLEAPWPDWLSPSRQPEAARPTACIAIANGSINATDVSSVKLKSGTSLP